MRRLVQLAPNMVRVSRTWGEQLVAWYAEDPSRTERSGDWHAASDPIKQGMAKAAEYAVATFLALEAKTAVKRNVKVVDGGFDVMFADGYRIDVKSSSRGKKWMLWSSPVNDSFERKGFDHLVSVSVDENDWSQCWIEGFMTKQEFFERKRIADGGNDGGKLKPGTWFVEKSELHDIGRLLAGFAGYNADGRLIHNCHCGRWGSHGYGTRLLRDEFGQWFCDEHKPKERDDEDQTQERAGDEVGQADDEVGAAAAPAGIESQQAVDATGEEDEEGWW